MSDPEPDGHPRLPQTAGRLSERAPAAPLRQHVDGVWINALQGPAVLAVVPDGCIDIYWTESDLRVAGPSTEVVTAAVEGAASLAGVRFRCGLAGRWLGVSAADLVNRHLPLEALWGAGRTRRLSERLGLAGDAIAAAAVLERALIGRLDRVGPADPLIGAVIAAAQRPGPRGIVRRLTEDLGCSERSLRRRCLAAFGYGPKTLERILRFQRFLRLGERDRVPLVALALDAGYADQAHLAREVRRLSGRTPRALVAELRACPGRFDQDASRPVA